MIEKKLRELQISIKIERASIDPGRVQFWRKNKACCKNNKLDVLDNEIQHDQHAANIWISDEKTANTLSEVFNSLSFPYLMIDYRQTKTGMSCLGFIIPAHYIEDKLPQIEKETVLEAKLGLLPEDQAILPPRGATLMDAALVSTFIDTLRAHYHIVHKEKEAEKEQGDQELSQGDELVPELGLTEGSGGAETANADGNNGSSENALSVNAMAVYGSSVPVRGAGKKKKQYDSSRKKNRKKNRTESHEGQSPTSNHNSYGGNDNSRMGNMGAAANLAHDSIKHNQAVQSTTGASGQAAAGGMGASTINGVNGNGNANSSVNHSHIGNTQNVNINSASTANVSGQNNAASQNSTPNLANASKVGGSSNHNTTPVQGNSSKQNYAPAQSNAPTSGNASKHSNAQAQSNPQKSSQIQQKPVLQQTAISQQKPPIANAAGISPAGGNTITPSPVDRIENAYIHAFVKTGEDMVTNTAHAVVDTAKRGVQTSTISSETPGGQQFSTYMRSSAPLVSWASQELKYGQMMQQASDAMHDQSFWTKVYAAKTDEKDLLIAQTELNKMLANAGLTEADFEGKNIIEAQAVMDKLEAARSSLAVMSNKDLNAWMDEYGGSVDDTVKSAIYDYRQALKDGKQGEIKHQYKILNDLLINSKLSLLEMTRMMGNIDKDFVDAMSTATSMQQLLELLKNKGHDANVLAIIGKLSFDDLKGSNGLSILKGALKEYGWGLEGRTLVMSELQALAHVNRIGSMGQMLIYLDNTQLFALFKSLKIDDAIVQKILEKGWDKFCWNPALLNEFIEKMADGVEKENLVYLQKVLFGQAARPSSLRRLSGKLAKQILRSALGASPGANALWALMKYKKTAKQIISMGFKIGVRASTKMFGEKALITRGLRFAQAPVRGIATKAAATTFGQSIVKSGFAKSLSGQIGWARKIAHMPGRFAGQATRWAAQGLKQAVSLSIKNIALGVKGFASAASTAVSGVLAGGVTAAGGGVVALAILGIVVAASIMSQKNTQEDTVGNYQYAQFDTELQAEIMNELQKLNDDFEVEVNKAATDRAYWSSGTGFSETDSAVHFEAGAYSIHFRDDQGNELEHLDIDNSKAILDMAAQYCKYANWKKPADNASVEQKTAYEQIKQYYLDYCKFLWVSTHRITLEEYRPGDEKYAEEDQSGLVTDSQGICPKNGTRVWLDTDFETGKLNVSATKKGETKIYECGVDNGNAENPEGVCDPVPEDDAYMSYGQHALCSHPLGGKDGWHVVTDDSGQPIKRTHYICNMEHECRICYDIEETEEVDEYGMGHTETYREYHTHYCGQHHYGEGNYSDDSVFSVENHRHTDYLWEYQCGGHMGAVVYVTVGNISRMKDMAPATDIDTSSLSAYPQETEAVTEEGE